MPTIWLNEAYYEFKKATRVSIFGERTEKKVGNTVVCCIFNVDSTFFDMAYLSFSWIN